MSYDPVDSDLSGLAANTIRMLAVDAIQKANSGHPGMPMGAADMTFALWSGFLNFDPSDPGWNGRDRFLLSAGHGSMLQYALLHLFGFDLSMDQIQSFRQLGSKTPGHPEYGHTPGVEVTTGPLGQGFANGVGMALAAKIVQARFEKDGFCPMGTRIFAVVSDGDLMEGISYEAAALAGHLELGNLVYLYDSNDICIEGPCNLAWSENIEKRFEGAGWHVQTVENGHDQAAIAAAVSAGIAEVNTPSIIICRTHIAYGSPGKQDTADSHGAPLGPDEVVATKKALGWPEDKEFYVPDEVAAMFSGLAAAKKDYRKSWDAKMTAWRKANPALAAEWDVWTTCTLPDDLFEKMLAALPEGAAATRALSGVVLNAASSSVPSLFGGSADLAPSNKTKINDENAVVAGDFSGRNMHFGIREHAMGAIANGISLYGCMRPYTGTFLVFADYMRPTMRMAALMKQPVIFVYTHDSFWVGEDGPTHQPIEQVSSLRLIPNMNVYRPADGLETAVAWEMALRKKDGPSSIVLTRQKLEPFDRPAGFTPDKARKGGYVACESAEKNCPNVLVASGSEVAMCAQAQKILKSAGIDVKVVSILCLEEFEKQPQSYRDSIIPPEAENVFWIEAGYAPCGAKFVKGKGRLIGMSDFGASAPGGVLADFYGFTPDKAAEKIKAALAE